MTISSSISKFILTTNASFLVMVVPIASWPIQVKIMLNSPLSLPTLQRLRASLLLSSNRLTHPPWSLDPMVYLPRNFSPKRTWRSRLFARRCPSHLRVWRSRNHRYAMGLPCSPTHLPTIPNLYFFLSPPDKIGPSHSVPTTHHRTLTFNLRYLTFIDSNLL